MQKFLEKVAQAGFATMLGYEVGERMSQESVVVKIEEPIVRAEPKDDTQENLLITLVVLFVVIVILILGVILRLLTRRAPRDQMIEMNDRRI